MIYLTGGKIVQGGGFFSMSSLHRRSLTILLLLALFASCSCVPATADHISPTSTKVFFEKNGEPYNDSVSFRVTCYGYVVDNSDPNRNNYWRGNYVRREPGTYNQTEVFSYSATVDHYGDEIFEPFYLNYRVIDYCSLCGETAGKEFFIENAGDSPIPNCSRRDYYPVDFESGSDVCYMSNDEFDKCYLDQSELEWQEVRSCDIYLEEFDKNKTYPPDIWTGQIDGVTMVKTSEFTECYESARSIDFNCSCFLDEVACRDITDPGGNPIERDCSLYYEIPAYENGTIIGTTIETDTEIPVIHAEPGIVYRNNFWIKLWEKYAYPLLSMNS